jgi:hypothetical protein
MKKYDIRDLNSLITAVTLEKAYTKGKVEISGSSLYYLSREFPSLRYLDRELWITQDKTDVGKVIIYGDSYRVPNKDLVAVLDGLAQKNTLEFGVHERVEALLSGETEYSLVRPQLSIEDSNLGMFFYEVKPLGVRVVRQPRLDVLMSFWF